MSTYLHPTDETGKQFYIDFHQKGPVVMLNLLKFKTVADYSDFPALKPVQEVTGKEAYDLYMACTAPHLKEAGSRVLFYGACNQYLIGPELESWDSILLVEHASVHSFMAFAQHEAYLITAGHRTAALADSRLLPISQMRLPGSLE
ncbi:MAG: DUF1330 domain-containing protein [Bacteroidota bacterium]